MLTTTVFIDFGEGLDRHIITTAGQLRRDLIGPDVAAINTLGEDTLIEVTPLQFPFQQLGIDFNDDGRGGDLNDWLAFRNATVELVKRQYAPFDINVEVVAARTTSEIKAMMARNGTGPGQADAYVWATGIYNGITGGSFTLLPGLLGIASAVDLTQTLHNVTDEVVVVDGEAMLSFTQQSPNFLGPVNYAVSMAFVISHEAGHTLSLRHTNSGGNPFGPLPGQTGTDQDLLSQSDIIREGPGGLDGLLNTGFFTRYPLMLGDGNTNQAITRNPFQILADEMGLRPGGPQYVTGTGAFDRITVTRLDSNSASVTVEPFRDNTFSAAASIPIATGGVYSYVLNGISNGIVIDGGRAEDQIIIDGLLGVPVSVRGGQGFDQLRINGTPAMNATFTPDTSYRFIPGNENYSNSFQDDRRQFVSYSGSIVAGFTQIRYDEFDDAGTVMFDNFGSVQFGGSAGFDNLVVINTGVAGTNEVDGTVAGVSFPNMRYTNVRSVVINTGASASADAVTINALNSSGLTQFTASTGPGNDFINVTAGSLQLGVPGGLVVLDFGAGSDTLNAAANGDWTLTDSILTSSLGGSASLQGLFRETANLIGGTSNNVFHVGGWNGVGRIFGQGGTDTVEITRDANFSIGENFVNILGSGGFLLSTVERLDITGGASSNTFIDYGWNGLGTLDGGAGATDMVAGFRDSHFTLSDNRYTAGNNLIAGSFALVNVELASLSGGAGFNQFDISARNTPAAINGGGGQDVVVYRGDSDVVLTNNSLRLASVINNFFSLASIEVAHLTGGAADNNFTISQWAGYGFIVGGGGDDTFNIGSGNLDAIAGPWNILGGLGTNDRIIINDVLGPAGNYIIGPNSVSIAPGAFRAFGGVFFDGTTENLRLNANNAANRIDVTPSLGTTFTVDGNAPTPPFGDTLVLHTAFTGPPNGPINGPGAGQRRFTFNAGHRDVIFEDIEQLLSAP